MVAGMVMPLNNLKAIYEHLFRDGVMVAKKDKRPQTKHPEIPGVDNLQVIRAMGSLKSRGYVKETFAWRHFYWYLTNTGIVYLRDYLHLPAEIVPTPLQRVRRPAETLAIGHRAARVQAIEGPTSYVPKPGRSAENQKALLDRQGYRRKTMSTDESEMIESSERMAKFRGRPMASSQIKPNESCESKDQPMFSDTCGYTKEMELIVRRKVAMDTISQMPPVKTYHAKPIKQEKMMEMELRDCTTTALVQKTQKVNISLDMQTISSTVGAIAVESPILYVPNEAVKDKPKEEVYIKVSHETTSTVIADKKTAKDALHPTPSKPKVVKIHKTAMNKEKAMEDVYIKVSQETTSAVIGGGRMAKDASQPTPSKPKVEKPTKITMTKENVTEDVCIKVTQEKTSTVTGEMAKDAPHPTPSKLKVVKPPKITVNEENATENVCIKVSQETTFTVTGETAKDAAHPTPSKPKVEKTQKILVTKNVQDVPDFLSTMAESSVSSVPTEAVKEKAIEDVCIKVSQETTSTVTDDSKKTKDVTRILPSKPKVEKTPKTTMANEKAIEHVCFRVSQETTSTVTGDSKTAKDAPHPTSSKPKVEKTQKGLVTKNVHEMPTVSSTMETIAVFSGSNESVKEKHNEDVFIKVSQETTSAVTGDSKTDTKGPPPTPTKSNLGRKQENTTTKSVYEHPIKNEKAAISMETSTAPKHVSTLHAAEPNTSINTQMSLESSVLPLSMKNNLARHIAEKKSEVNVPQQTPHAISAAEVKAEVKGHKPEPTLVSQSPSTGPDAKINKDDTVKTSEVFAKTVMKLEFATATPKLVDSVQQKPSSAKPTEKPVAESKAEKDIYMEDASKPLKGKKKNKSANKTPGQIPQASCNTIFCKDIP
ncbi:uncharacterized protein LOC127453354 [Myxocyprinus asiaticus]|uniref:uncharacterized protein LOC127453354 n=1 Tax=Myxocyprinus asiaticus TaxID=70543 RepID=UPI0022216AB5|nr:uncharacterized protein LOC127453354 [Myxocyprinus asiaticus]